ncbi:hypothetical protein Lal_00028175 [Lupinus albus]|nr:hypothetical protein Lal_00028175 [Lupinus albus]
MGELYYVRMMLTVVKGPTCYEDIRTVSNIEYPTSRDACFAIGKQKTRPNHVWEETWQWLSDEILYNLRNISNNQGLVLNDEQLQNLTLLEIEKLLEGNQRTLKDYPSMLYSNGYVTCNDPNSTLEIFFSFILFLSYIQSSP